MDLRSTALKDAGARTLEENEKVAKTTKEKTNSDQPSADRAKRVVVSTEVPHDMRICIEDLAESAWQREEGARVQGDQRFSKLVKSQTTSCGSFEWSETGVSSVGRWTKSFSAMKRWFALQSEDEMKFFNDTTSAMCGRAFHCCYIISRCTFDGNFSSKW